MLKLILALAIPLSTVILVGLFYLYQRAKSRDDEGDLESLGQQDPDGAQAEDLFIFQGGEDLTICDILEAPGEVIGKSNYGTLYKALLQRSSGLRLLRFLRPVCAAGTPEFVHMIEFLGSIKHPNLVPLLGFYSGPRGEKLLIFPFYRRGNLAEFIQDSSGESHRWSVIYKVAIGIARGLDHLHTGLMKPMMIHGNLKSRNVLLDRHHEPRISDFGLHLLLNPAAGQEMLDTLASEGYKAPELIKMKEANGDTDIYGLGVILLELVTGKEPVNDKAGSDGELYLPNYLRNAVLGQRLSDLYRPGILSSNREDVGATEERVLKLFQLGMACCSHSPSLRPNIKQVVRRLEEIGSS